MKILLIVLLSFCSIVQLYGQSRNKMASNEALPWVHGNFPDNSKSVNYKVVFGDGEQLPVAQKNAIKSLLFDLGAEKGVTVSTETIIEVEEKVLNKKSSIKSDYRDQITIKQDGFNVSFYKVDEYYEKVKENGKFIYRCWQLYAIGNNLSGYIKPIEYTTKYGFDAGIRSIFIPGWGQLYKKKNTKGIIFMSLEAIAIGNIIYAQSRYNYNTNRMAEAFSLEIQREYKSRADDNLMYRNLSIGVAIATMLWSTIDAVATDGAPKYANLNKKLEFKLYSSPETYWAIGLQYNF